VLALKSAADDWQARSRAAIESARRANDWRQRLAAQIEARPPPPNGDELTLCRAADAVLKEGAP
jgi:hypothetical protein